MLLGTGCTGAISKFLHLIGIPPRKQGLTRYEAHRCTFPGCLRTFADHTALVLHARTHQDGDRTALGRAGHAGVDEIPESPPASPTGANGNPKTLSPHPTRVDVNPESLPVVFVGPMEHHSNLLVWREAECVVIEVEPDETGRADRAKLAKLLDTYVGCIPLPFMSKSVCVNICTALHPTF